VMPAVRDEHKLQATFQLPCLNKLYRYYTPGAPLASLQNHFPASSSCCSSSHPVTLSPTACVQKDRGVRAAAARSS
jgi:hypothetical protein